MRKWDERVALALVAVLTVAGCDKKKDTPSNGDSASVSIQEAVEKQIEEAADKAGAQFDKGMSKKSCEILTPALVAQTFSVPEAELKQLKIMGCIYTWKKEEGETKTMLEATLTLMRVHDSV